VLCCVVPQRNPVLRPSAAEALEHPWLAVEGEANEMPLKVGVLCRAVVVVCRDEQHMCPAAPRTQFSMSLPGPLA
jgi:hypothetical protein